MAVFVLANRGISEPTVESAVSRYAKELRAIGTEVPIQANSEPNWIQLALDRLAAVKANAQTVESIARDLEHQLATRLSGCAYAKAAGDAIGKELAPARGATMKALDGLLSGTNDRLRSRNTENSAHGWVGWRGSREEEISGLVLLAHEIEMARTGADLAFARLDSNVAALNKAALFCQKLAVLSPGNSPHVEIRRAAL